MKGEFKNYVSGGNTGGISNLALLVSEVPVNKDEMIAHKLFI